MAFVDTSPEDFARFIVDRLKEGKTISMSSIRQYAKGLSVRKGMVVNEELIKSFIRKEINERGGPRMLHKETQKLAEDLFFKNGNSTYENPASNYEWGYHINPKTAKPKNVVNTVSVHEHYDEEIMRKMLSVTKSAPLAKEIPKMISDIEKGKTADDAVNDALLRLTSNQRMAIRDIHVNKLIDELQRKTQPLARSQRREEPRKVSEKSAPRVIQPRMNSLMEKRAENVKALGGQIVRPSVESLTMPSVERQQITKMRKEAAKKTRSWKQ